MQRNKMLTSGLAVAMLLLCWQPGEAGQRKKARKAEQPPAASTEDGIVNAIGSFIGAMFSKEVSEAPDRPVVPTTSLPPGCSFITPADCRPPTTTSSVPPAESCARCVVPTPATSAEDAQVQEFIKIINECKSPATLVATAIALLPLGDKAKPAVPALLRNAERLKVLDDIGNPGSRKGEMAAMLMEIVFAIQSGWTPDDDRPSVINQRWGMQPRYPVAPPPPVMPTPYYMPSGPACTPGVCPPGPPAQPLPPACPSPLCPTSGYNESPFRW